MKKKVYKTTITYPEFCKQYRYEVLKHFDDSIPINYISHPKPKFNLWKRIKAVFVRPKFSKEALEPADKLHIQRFEENY